MKHSKKASLSLIALGILLLATGCAGKKCKGPGGGGGPGPGGDGEPNGPQARGRQRENEELREKNSELQQNLDEALAQLNNPLGQNQNLGPNGQVIDRNQFTVPDGATALTAVTPVGNGPGLTGVGGSISPNNTPGVTEAGFAPSAQAPLLPSANRLAVSKVVRTSGNRNLASAHQ